MHWQEIARIFGRLRTRKIEIMFLGRVDFLKKDEEKFMAFNFIMFVELFFLFVRYSKVIVNEQLCLLVRLNLYGEVNTGLHLIAFHLFVDP